MEGERKVTRFIRYDPFELPAHKYALQKTINFGQIGGIVGFCFGIANNACSRAAPTAATTIVRFATPTAVTAVSGIAYGTVLSLLGTLREKDDSMNHFAAGFCAGAIPGSMVKSNPVGAAIFVGLISGFTLGIFKASYIHNGGKKRVIDYDAMKGRKQVFTRMSDVETKPEYAKYFK